MSVTTDIIPIEFKFIPIEFKLYAIEKENSLQLTIANFINLVNKGGGKSKINFIDYIDDGTIFYSTTIESEKILDFTKELNKKALEYIIIYLNLIEKITYGKKSIRIDFTDKKVITDIYVDNIIPEANDIRSSITSKVIMYDFLEKNRNTQNSTALQIEQDYKNIFKKLKIENEIKMQFPKSERVPLQLLHRRAPDTPTG